MTAFVNHMRHLRGRLSEQFPLASDVTRAFLASVGAIVFTTSDVAVTSTRSRRAFIVMSISAMTFNTVVIALLVSGIITLASN